jgi:type II secretory pathway pseudopilin PulG
MIKTVIIGLAAAGAAIAAQAGTDKVLALREAHSAAAVARSTEARKTHEINVPRIKDGAIKGYAVMLLSYTVDTSALKTAAMAPDSILVDEAFRYVYDDDTIDFDHLDRFDLAKMSKALARSVNARVKADVVVDVGVQEFTYAPIGDTHGRPGP